MFLSSSFKNFVTFPFFSKYTGLETSSDPQPAIFIHHSHPTFKIRTKEKVPNLLCIQNIVALTCSRIYDGSTQISKT
jgi:hypothetical protein